MDDRAANVVIVGAGGHARVVAESVGAKRLAGFLSPDGSAAFVEGLGERLGSDQHARQLFEDGFEFALGIGFVDRLGALTRAKILASFEGFAMLTVVHDRASVARSATIHPGAFVAAGAVVGTSAVVSAGSIVNTGAVVDHDVIIGKNVHVGPGAVISGMVSVGQDTLVGVGSTIRQGLHIGARVVVGAGAVVVDDVDDDDTVLGVPARPTRPL